MNNALLLRGLKLGLVVSMMSVAVSQATARELAQET